MFYPSLQFMIYFYIQCFASKQMSISRPQSVQLKIIFLFLNQNICCGYLKHMFKLVVKKLIAILLSIYCLTGAMTSFEISTDPYEIPQNKTWTDTFIRNMRNVRSGQVSICDP